MKVCVYAIVKNESKNVEKFMVWAKHADLVLIGDTGSEDNTKELFSKYDNVKVIDVHLDFWRFDEARNRVLNEIPEDYDICVSADLDEVMKPIDQWINIVKKYWIDGVNRLEYRYQGSPTVVFLRSKIHSKKDFIWKYAVHEEIEPIFSDTENKKYVPELFLIHNQDGTKSRPYLDLLKITVEEFPQNSQRSFWYMRELVWAKKYDEAIIEGNRFLTISNPVWFELGAVYRYLGDCYFAKGDNKNAEKHLILGCGYEDSPESWTALSRYYYNIKDWVFCYFAALKSFFRRDNKCNHYLCNKDDHLKIPLDMLSVSGYYAGFKEQSKNFMEMLIKLYPNVERYKENYKHIFGGEYKEEKTPEVKKNDPEVKEKTPEVGTNVKRLYKWAKEVNVAFYHRSIVDVNSEPTNLSSLDEFVEYCRIEKLYDLESDEILEEGLYNLAFCYNAIDVFSIPQEKVKLYISALLKIANTLIISFSIEDSHANNQKFDILKNILKENGSILQEEIFTNWVAFVVQTKRELVFPKNMAIVANGPAEKDTGNGGKIDAFDNVLRMNNFHIDDEWSKDYGTKVTHWASSMFLNIEHRDFDFKNVYVCASERTLEKSPDTPIYLTYQKNKERLEEYKDKLHYIPEKYMENLWRIHYNPSTGLILLYWMYRELGYIPRENLFGFSFFDAGQDHHYFGYKYFEKGFVDKKHTGSQEKAIVSNILTRRTQSFHIPKVLNFIWVGSGIPKWAEELIDQFKKLNLDYKIKIHGEKILDPDYREIYERVSDFATKSDLLRISALKKYGGWYFDCDYIPLQSIGNIYQNYPSLCDTGCFLTRQHHHEESKVIANGCIGVAKDSWFLREAHNYIMQHSQNDDIKRTTFGPTMTTTIYKKNPDKITISKINDFYPVNDRQKCALYYKILSENNFSEEKRKELFDGLSNPLFCHLWMGGKTEI